MSVVQVMSFAMIWICTNQQSALCLLGLWSSVKVLQEVCTWIPYLTTVRSLSQIVSQVCCSSNEILLTSSISYISFKCQPHHEWVLTNLPDPLIRCCLPLTLFVTFILKNFTFEFGGCTRIGKCWGACNHSKSLLRVSNAVAIITFLATLLTPSMAIRWQHFADILISVEAVLGKL